MEDYPIEDYNIRLQTHNGAELWLSFKRMGATVCPVRNERLWWSRGGFRMSQNQKTIAENRKARHEYGSCMIVLKQV